MLKLNERLTEERERLGYTQVQLAKLVGVSKTTQNYYDTGKRSPTADYLEAIAALGADVLYIVTGTRTPMPADSLSPEETQVVIDYRSIPSDEQAAIRRVTSALAQTLPAPEEEDDEESEEDLDEQEEQGEP
ncbi:helix-turn-helix domain-containing protein [Pseudomonas indica]|uniref:helix-turn-helix domain-containing protein n=1 Tax=Pseudomonas indica TaxID=137658 RepID=UPI0023F67A24|nr:helix-turn-helix transcriptional regulator [Pseudomonas indica]MBU3059424.1 helix-turn-helix domain-containing protein [Pseudomonas indica]